MDRKQLVLYAITDRGYLNGVSLYDAVEQALKGGASIIQLREKELGREALRAEAAALKKLCRKYDVPLILDDDVALAKELDLDGVHIGQDDMPAYEARKILGPDKIIGVTAKTVRQAEKAALDGADYLGSGAVFATSTKPLAKHMSIDELKEIVSCVDIPVVAIGGINAGNVLSLKDCGIAGAAVSEAVFAAEDIRAAAEELSRILVFCGTSGAPPCHA